MHIPQKAIELAIKGGFVPRCMKVTWSKTRTQAVFACSSTFWRALGKSLGWATSKYRACEMIKPFYVGETMRGTGVIVGESKDKKQWYVRWDYNKQGRSTMRIGTRNPYPKANILEKSKDLNWQLVAYHFFDLILQEKDPTEWWEELLAGKD